MTNYPKLGRIDTLSGLSFMTNKILERVYRPDGRMDQVVFQFRNKKMPDILLTAEIHEGRPVLVITAVPKMKIAA